MGKIEKFLAKPQEVTIAGDKYMVKPFTVKELPLMMKAGSADEEVRFEAMMQLMRLFIKKLHPDATEEELDNVALDMEIQEEIMDAIMKVNNLPEDTAKAELMKKLKPKQDESSK